MRCEIDPIKFLDIAQKLIKSNKKYKDFDNVVEFMLKLPMVEEQRVLSLHALAKIYKGLSENYPEDYNKGKAENILVLPLDNDEKFIKSLNEFYKPKKVTEVKEESIYNAFKKLPNGLLGQDLNPVLGLIESYITNNFSSDREQAAKVAEVFAEEMYNTVLAKAAKPIALYLAKEFKAKVLNVARYNATYMDINSLPELTTVIVVTTKNKVHDTVRNEKGEYVDVTSGEVIPQSSVKEYYDARPSKNTNYVRANNGDRVFTVNDLLTGMVIIDGSNRRSSGEDKGEALKTLSNTPTQALDVAYSVRAILTPQDVYKRRIERLHEAHKDSVPSILNRTLETFEDAAQITKLFTDSVNGEILTLSREVNRNFVLKGVVHETGEEFFIYAPDNYVFVKSDNTTERVNFNNPDHIRRLQNITMVNDSAETNIPSTRRMTAKEVSRLQSAYNLFLELSGEVNGIVTPNAPVQDVTDIFKKYYSIEKSGNYLFTGTPGQAPLQEYLDQLPELNKQYDVQRPDGSIVKKNVMFLLVNKGKKGPLSAELTESNIRLRSPFIIESNLEAGEQIIIDGKKYDPFSALVNEFKTSTKSGEKVLAEVVTNIINNKRYSGKSIHNAILIGARNQQPIVLYVANKKFGSTLSTNTRFVSALYQALNDAQGKSYEQIKEISFNLSKQFAFKYIGQFFLEPTIEINEDGVPAIGIELKTSDTTLHKFGLAKDESISVVLDKVLFNNNLTKNIEKTLLIDPMNNAFGDGEFSIKELSKYIPKLKGINTELKTEENYSDFLEILQDTVHSNPDNIPAVNAMNYYRSTAEKFAEFIDKNVLNIIYDNVPQEVKDALDNNIKYRHLLAYEKVYSSPERAQGYFNSLQIIDLNRRSNKPEDFYVIGNRISDSVVVAPAHDTVYSTKKRPKVVFDPLVSKEEQQDAIEREEVKPETAERINKKLKNLELDLDNAVPLTPGEQVINEAASDKIQEENKDDNADLSIDSFDDAPFSLDEDQSYSEFTLEEKTEIREFFRRTLPQFGLTIEDLSKFEKGVSSDSAILGLFRDNIVFLDKNKAGGGVGYHEAFHAVFRSILDTETKSKLLDSVKSDKRYSKYFTKEYKEEFKRRRKRPAFEGVEDLIAEEILAENFRKYKTRSGIKKIIADFFELLKSIIRFFNKDAFVQSKVFSNINKGYYKNAPLASTMTSDPVYQLLKTRPRIIENAYTNKPSKQEFYLDPADQKQLIFKITKHLVDKYAFSKANWKLSRKEFDEALKEVAEKYYDINDLLNQDDGSNRSKILQKYGDLYKDVNFLINPTGKEKAVNHSEDPRYTNTVSLVGYDVSKELDVLFNYVKKLTTVLDVDIQEDVDAEIEDEEGNTIDESAEEIGDDAVNFDESFYNIDVMNSIPKETRKMLSLVEYKKLDEELGIEIDSMVDGGLVFSILIKSAANKPKEDILKTIVNIHKRYEYDRYENDRRVLKAVSDVIKERSKIDDNGALVGKDNILYHQLINLFDKAEMSAIMINSTKIQKYDPEVQQDILVSSSTRVEDILIKEDINAKLNSFLYNIIYTNSKNNEEQRYTKEYTDALNSLLEISSFIHKTHESGSFISDSNIELTLNELDDAFKVLGITIPKSAIKFSILSLDKINNRDLSEEEEQYLYSDREFRNNYLDSVFFLDLSKLASDLLSGKKLYTDADKQGINLALSNKSYGRFFLSIRKILPYIIKYDTRSLPSVVRNADGKKIYRFTYTTPGFNIIKDVRVNGIESYINDYEHDALFSRYQSRFWRDNYFINAALNALNDPKDINLRSKLFFDNIKLSLFGGYKSSVNGELVQGATFKRLKPSRLNLSKLQLFASRETIEGTYYVNQEKDGVVTTTKKDTVIKTYNKLYPQLEASSTSFGITGLIFDNFSEKEKALPYIKQILYQELSRISREWNERRDRLNDYNNGNNYIVDGYNGVNKNNIIDVESDSLRAYNFTELTNVFSDETEAKLKELAKSESLSKAELQSRISSNKELNSAVSKDLLKFIDRLIDDEINLAQEHGIINVQDNGDIFFKENIDITEDGKKESILSRYPSSRAFFVDYALNEFLNNAFVNQLITGDRNLGIKDTVSLFKRNKGLLASGNRATNPYRIAYVEDLMLEIDKADLTVNQKDITRTTPQDKTSIVFDGQALNTINHRIDMFEEMGRLKSDTRNILIAANYRKLTPAELSVLKAERLPLNSLKTVHNDPSRYLKLSEHVISKNDVSYIDYYDIKEAHLILDAAYKKVYVLRKKIQDALLIGSPVAQVYDSEIKKIFNQVIHPFFKPLPGREELHQMLNSMEYHQIDMLMDTNASKKAKVLPISAKDISNGYINLNMSTETASGKFKYLQVETSRIKDESKASVQAKILLGADLILLAEALDKDGSKGIYDDLVQLSNEYQFSLYESAVARLERMESLARNEDGNIDISNIIKNIRNSLEEQGADSNTLSFFELDKNGEPRFDINYPIIRKQFLNHFFKQYSNLVFDEKVKGKKFVHATSYGYKIVEEFENIGGEIVPVRIVPLEEVKQNPDRYTDPTKYRYRYPGVKEEVVIEGNKAVKLYTVEVLIPRPYNVSEEELEFILKQASEGFGTRIPTEDKRSMVAFKIVDFIDPFYENTIIVPQLVHLLAGSDLDIDALYTHMYDYYRDLATGKLKIYGEYGENRAEDAFIEYLSEKAEDKVIKRQIAENYSDLSEDLEVQSKTIDDIKNIISDADTDAVLKLAGVPSIDEFFTFGNVEFESYNQALKEIRTAIREEVRDLKEVTALINEAQGVESDSDPKKLLNWSDLSDLRSKEKALVNIKPYVKNYIKISSVLAVLRAKGLPTNVNGFKDNPVKSVKALQNKNLQTKLNILKNEYVFENLYITQLADPVYFKEEIAGRMLGKKASDISERFHASSGAGSVATFELNAGGKDGIGITANFNKGLALISTADLYLREPIWKIVDRGTIKTYSKYGGTLRDRGIKEVGNVLGMFADAAKEPTPGLLNLNTVNEPITLSMLALGINADIAVLINFAPLIREAVKESYDSIVERFPTLSLKASLTKQRKRYATEVKNLENLGIVEKGGYKLKDNVDIVLIYNKPTSTIPNDPSLSDLGLRLEVSVDGETPEGIGESEQEVILSLMYLQQFNQTYDISKMSNVVNLFKPMPPSLQKMLTRSRQYREVDADNTVFIGSSKVFEDYTAFKPLLEGFRRMENELSTLLIEFNPAFKTMVSNFMAFNPDNSELIGETFSSTNILFKLYSNAINESPINPQEDVLHTLFLEMTKASYWFNEIGKDVVTKDGHTIMVYSPYEIVSILKSYFPDNALINSLSVITSKNNRGLKYNYIGLSAKAKALPEMKKDLSDSYFKIMTDPRPEVKYISMQLFVHEIVRTGLSASYSRSFSDYISSSRHLMIDDIFKDFKQNILEDGQDLQSYFGGLYKKYVTSLYSNMIGTVEDSAKIKQVTPPMLKYNKNDIQSVETPDGIGYEIKLSNESQSLAAQLGIKKNIETLQYTFPPVIKSVNGVMLVLRQLDDQSIVDILASKLNLKQSNVFDGDSALYVPIPSMTYKSKEISMLALPYHEKSNFYSIASNLIDDETAEQLTVRPVAQLPSNTINVYSSDLSEYSKLSNFKNGPVTITTSSGQTRTLDTVEKAYQIQKALFAGDRTTANIIFKTQSPVTIKSLGSRIKMTDEQVAEWNKISYSILKDLMRNAFNNNPANKDLLLSTGMKTITYVSPNKSVNLGRWETDFPKILMELREEFSKFKEGETFKPEEKIIKDQDIEKYKLYLIEYNGVQPQEFETSDYQDKTWKLNKNGLYDLFDNETNEIVKENVDLFTGYNMILKKNEPVKLESKEVVKPVSKISNTGLEQDDTLKPSDFTNHSGGAYGGDTFWDLIGREFGVTNHKHYKDANNANLSQQLRNKGVQATVLSEEQMNFARQQVKDLLGITYKNNLKDNLQVRNFYQVYNADAVYAIAKLNPDNKSVKGGTNTAVRLGIKLNKPVYVWDINTEQWYKFDNTQNNLATFKPTETPVLTKNFAGVGSRDIENYNVLKDGKWQPRKEYVGKEKEEKAKQAIRDVYQKTLNTVSSNTPKLESPQQVELKTEYPLYNENDKTLRKGSVVEYNGQKYLFWNENSDKKAQLIKADGTKFSGTPSIDKLKVLGNYRTVIYNGNEYIVTNKENVYSGVTGKLVYTGSDNSSKIQKQSIVSAAKNLNNIDRFKEDVKQNLISKVEDANVVAAMENVLNEINRSEQIPKAQEALGEIYKNYCNGLS